jgi:hypothetical protein
MKYWLQFPPLNRLTFLYIPIIRDQNWETIGVGEVMIVAKNKNNKKPAQDVEFASENAVSNKKQQNSATQTQNLNK